MSASPPTVPNQSTKRPLEEPSSPSAPTDQPDAKRPALDKGDAAVSELPIVSSNGDLASTNGTKDEQGDTVVLDAVPQSIESTGTSTKGQNTSSMPHDESGWIHVRAVITSAEAATVIGKGGENVSTIRKNSGAKCTVSDYQKGAVERILTVSGIVDAVAKVRVMLRSRSALLTQLRHLDLSSAHSTTKTSQLHLIVPRRHIHSDF